VPVVATDPTGVEPRPVLWRVTDRRAFTELRRNAVRASARGLWLAFVPAPPASARPPRVAFAVARGSGGAIERNRIRRRLRAGLRTLAAAGALPAGDYLVGAGPDAALRPWTELGDALHDLVTRATAGRA
jgi:ribonuclease P protein component